MIDLPSPTSFSPAIPGVPIIPGIPSIPSVNVVHRARKAIQYEIHKTPLVQLEHPIAWNLAAEQDRVFLKCENFQISGSFKIRGALHAISRLSEEQRRSGIISACTGNFACALACATERLGIDASIVLGEDVSESDLRYSSAYHPDIIHFSGQQSDAALLVNQMALDTGKTLLIPEDNPNVMAGYATIAVEILEELPDMQNFICPVGSGMLLASCARVIKEIRPSCRIIAVEPTGADDFAQSLSAGRRIEIARSESLAGCLNTRSVTPGAWELLKNTVDTAISVPCDEIRRVMKLLYQRLDMAVEPAAAVTLAALNHASLRGIAGTTVCLMSGANIDAEKFVRTVIPPCDGVA
jgi:threonine dehydratase